LLEKPEGKTHVRKPRRRWDDNIKIGLKETGFGNMDYIHLAHNEVQWGLLLI
jgi:hypothetical protein